MLPYWRLSAYYFCYFGFVGAFSPYFNLYLQSLAFSAWDIGVFNAVMQFARIAAPNLWGWVAERLGARMPVVRLAALMSLAGFASFFLTRSFGGMFAGMAVMAFFWSAALPLVEALTLAHLGTQPQRYGGIRLWGSVGFIVAVLGIGAALDRLPIDALLPMASATLIGILACALLVPEAAQPAHHDERVPLREILSRRDVRALFGACFFMAAAHGALYVFYSMFLVAAGYSKTVVSWLWTLGVLAEIAVFMLMPRLMRACSLRTILAAAFACAVVRFMMIGWGVESLPMLVAAQLLHGATFGAYHAAAVAAIGRWFGARLQARGQALYGSVSFGAGGMLGGLVSGYTWDRFGGSATFGLSSVFALVGLAVLLAGWREARAVPAAG